MGSGKDEETSVENSKQDDECDVCFDTADGDDANGAAPTYEVDAQISVEAWVH